MAQRTVLGGGAVYLGSGKFYHRGYVVIEGETIVGLGEGDFGKSGGCRVIDVSGGTILPGLADSHIHLVAYALSRLRLDLTQVASLDSALAMIRERVKGLKPGEWLLGRGWDKQRWKLEHFPTRWMLDRVAPSNPVALDSHDGHLVWINSAALRELGLEKELPQVEGGKIEIDSQGRPTGIFMEKAVSLVRSKINYEDLERCVNAIRDACDHLASLGLTCVHTIEGKELSRLLDIALREGKVGLHLFRMQEIGSIGEMDEISPSTQGIKLYADGALGSQTAYMFEAYKGQPENFGIRASEKEEIEEMAMAAAGRGLGVAVHAIGDRANSEVLDAYEKVRAKYPGANLRIEHAQVLCQADVKRFATLGIVASMQPIHAVSDMDVASRYWGERCKHAYAWRDLLEAGTILAFGSDAPIEDPDPLKGIHAAVTRARPGEKLSWYPEQCLSIGEAIDCYTKGASIAAGCYDRRGSIAVGKQADLTVLSSDILGNPDSDVISQTKVRMTIIGGRVAYAA